MKMKKLSMLLLSGLIFNSSTKLFASPSISLNGIKVFVPQSPFVEAGTTYVPLRTVSEALGATVDYKAATKTITISNKEVKIVTTVGSKQAKVNGQPVTLTASPKVKGSATYVPLRFVSEYLGAGVNYNKSTGTIELTYDVPQDPNKKYVDGRAIRTTNLPKNASDFKYILEGVPNEMYEVKARYEGHDDFTEGQEFVKARNMENENYYSTDNLKEWIKKLEENLNLRLNVDYRTINQEWGEALLSTYKGTTETVPEIKTYYRERYSKYINDYIEYIKKNKVVINGDCYVEPSICYYTFGNVYIRCKVSYTGISANGTFKLFENLDTAAVKGTYEGYIDIGLSTPNYDIDGCILGIVDDNITRYLQK